MTPTQLSLPAARRTDPVTSHRAAASIGKGVERAVMSIHKLCAVLPQNGLTDSELVALLPSFHPPTVISARSRLKNDGRLIDSGTTRPSSRGRDSIVWRCA